MSHINTIGPDAGSRTGAVQPSLAGSSLRLPPLSAGSRAVRMRHSPRVTGFILSPGGLGVKRTRRLRAILIRFSQASSNGRLACGCGCLTTPPHRRSKPMLTGHARVSDTPIRADAKQKGVAPGDNHSSAPPDSPTQSEWFEAADALVLLNSMVKRMHTGPRARPLLRW
ncbi:hypothetical protein J3D48_006114 [Pseudomonas fluorescens]|nr:hypothetical protein [Pseudomonas fluorescens]